ncbi:MAG: hypothetical protein SCH70_07810 [Candidatus Methanoperedens sp.]|nr:hypothetical protein [Candidatus Methanoperedens sp.]
MTYIRPCKGGERGYLYYNAPSAGLDPHGNTVRATITVPAGKKMRIDNVVIGMNITQAASSAGDRQFTLYRDNGTDIISISRNFIRRNKNTVGDELLIAIQPLVICDAGDIVYLRSTDASTGGKTGFYGVVWYTLL